MNKRILEKIKRLDEKDRGGSSRCMILSMRDQSQVLFVQKVPIMSLQKL